MQCLSLSFLLLSFLVLYFVIMIIAKHGDIALALILNV